MCNICNQIIFHTWFVYETHPCRITEKYTSTLINKCVQINYQFKLGKFRVEYLLSEEIKQKTHVGLDLMIGRDTEILLLQVLLLLKV